MKEKSSKKESIKKDREKEEDASSLVSAEPQNALSRQPALALLGRGDGVRASYAGGEG
jgi:hypothetical protein